MVTQELHIKLPHSLHEKPHSSHKGFWQLMQSHCTYVSRWQHSALSFIHMNSSSYSSASLVGSITPLPSNTTSLDKGTFLLFSVLLPIDLAAWKSNFLVLSETVRSIFNSKMFRLILSPLTYHVFLSFYYHHEHSQFSH